MISVDVFAQDQLALTRHDDPHPASNEHTAHTHTLSLSKFPDSAAETQTPLKRPPQFHVLVLLRPLHCVRPLSFLGSSVNRVPDQNARLPTARTNLTADLCFCNGHLTPSESWLCSCSCSSVLVLPARDPCHRVVHGLSLSLVPAGGRCDGMRWDGMGAASCNRPAPSRLAPGNVDRSPVSSLGYHHAQQHLHNGAHKTPICPPAPGPTQLTCAHPCGSEGFVSRLSPILELMSPPLSHTLQHRIGGHGLALLPPQPAGLPSFLPTRPA